MSNGQEGQNILNQEHLRLLSIFYYVSAGLTAFFASIPIVHVFLGLMMVFASGDTEAGTGEEIPAFIGWIFVIIGGVIVLFGWLLAAAKAYAGYSIGKRKNRMFSLIVAGFTCLGIPYGTVLGIFTFVVLTRESVKELYGRNMPAKLHKPAR